MAPWSWRACAVARIQQWEYNFLCKSAQARSDHPLAPLPPCPALERDEAERDEATGDGERAPPDARSASF